MGHSRCNGSPSSGLLSPQPSTSPFQVSLMTTKTFVVARKQREKRTGYRGKTTSAQADTGNGLEVPQRKCLGHCDGRKRRKSFSFFSHLCFFIFVFPRERGSDGTKPKEERVITEPISKDKVVPSSSSSSTLRKLGLPKLRFSVKEKNEISSTIESFPDFFFVYKWRVRARWPFSWSDSQIS